MKRLLLATLALSACVSAGAADETALAPGSSKMDWTLTEVDGRPAGYVATLNLGEPGRISGRGPCNRYFGPLQRESTGFVPGALAATRMACPDMADEVAFFRLLSGITTAETGPGVLVLSGGGHQMRWVQPID